VFESFGAPLGNISLMPDGEVGPRRHWISRMHYQALAAHPELNIVQRPAPDENSSVLPLKALPRRRAPRNLSTPAQRLRAILPWT
jgi:hypothetical protein